MLKHLLLGVFFAMAGVAALVAVVSFGHSKPWRPMPNMKKMRECWS